MLAFLDGEDRDDAVDADAAMEAPGASVPLTEIDRAEQQRVIDDVHAREADGTPRRRSRATQARGRAAAKPVPPEDAKPAVAVPEAPAAECGHSFPDVKWVAGARVCRKCG